MPRWRPASASPGDAAAVAAASSSEPARPLAGGNARVSPEVPAEREGEGGEEEEGRWSALVPELLADILRRVDAGAERWPGRRDVVVCACVCRRWREAAVALVRPPLQCGGITFLSSLKQPGPRDAPIQCFIKRNKKKSTFHLYLSLTQDHPKCNIILSSYCNDIKNYLQQPWVEIGQIPTCHIDQVTCACRSDFTRTKFTIYDWQPQYEGAKVPSSRCRYWFASKQIKPLVSTGIVDTGEVSYEYNLLKSRGPRRIHCSIQCPAIEGTAIDPEEVNQPATPSSLVLYNKLPRWHEHLQCWCLNFNGRVMVASVKNFQLIAPTGTGEPWGVQDDETVILQFGKIEDDVFTMDYRQPLSAFQAFAICLTSFGSKLACE
ncbi:Tubby-like F-box protein 2 [Dichanthelium oligosanthes]|uniref:Tubby-like F-box protein 2 n=1 Tax=Dichanthelium oligosanthes TaxID=888268 RepID=A0A1E5VPZ2_9POAL|nr:Tubby-like F-box protein 2 [Dichanthelium oligosanthes]